MNVETMRRNRCGGEVAIGERDDVQVPSGGLAIFTDCGEGSARVRASKARQMIQTESKLVAD